MDVAVVVGMVPSAVLTLLVILVVYVIFASLQKPHGKTSTSDPIAS